MYCLYVGDPFWPHKFCFKPLLGLESMAPIRLQLLVSHANLSATETSHVRMYVYVCVYVCMYLCVYVCMYVLMYACMYVCIYLIMNFN